MTIIEVRPGEGGADAMAFACELSDALASYLRRRQHDWQDHPARTERTIVGYTTESLECLIWLAGTHRIQRVPRGSNARHTSTATVAILPDVQRENSHLQDGELRVDRYRGRGRGGQRKNKVSTAIRVVHRPSGMVVTRETGRSQKVNLNSAIADIEARLDAQRAGQVQALVQASRRKHVIPEREAKTFTHNEQRGEVVDHATGRRWRMRDWKRGAIEA